MRILSNNGGLEVSEKIYYELRDLINDEERKTELECKKYIEHTKELLLKGVIEFRHTEPEYRGHVGDSDYVLSGLVSMTGDIKCVRVNIWELKAPQCYIFQEDTKNRLKPSFDLIDAENKLLHYYQEQKGNDQFRQDFEVIHPDDVCLGGIIIGCNRTKVIGKYEDRKKEILYQRAIYTRNLFYKPAGITLYTWDQILEHLRPAEAIRHEITLTEAIAVQAEVDPTAKIDFKEFKP